ncbi:M17 family peptidase N-terminal domain-containing protein, partial [Hamadaea sp. NPDC051192]|uniref:M17 family peptidase N-terminal domain-containing protein n=1 Tax=Hamadaea sp. NPDC051192 TaxID=3154940 RepID=UPI003416D2F1
MTTSIALSLFDTDPAELAVDAVVIGVHSPGEDAESRDLLLASGAQSVAAAFDGRLSATLSLLGATGSAGEITKLATLGAITAPIVVAVGLGPEPTGRPCRWRAARAAAASPG